MDEQQNLHETSRGQITLRRYGHQEIHQLVVKLDLGDGIEEFQSSFFVHFLFVEELVGNVLKEDEGSIEVAFIGAAKVYAVDQAHVPFLKVFQVDQLPNNL